MFPSTLEDLRELTMILKEYTSTRLLYTLIFFSSAYLFKQSFAIPGSVFLVSRGISGCSDLLFHCNEHKLISEISLFSSRIY